MLHSCGHRQDDKALTFDRTLITGVSFDPHFFPPFHFNDRNSVLIKIGIVMLTLFMVQGAVNAFIMDQSSGGVFIFVFLIKKASNLDRMVSICAKS